MKNSIKKILNMLFALGCLACLIISIMDYIHDDMLHAIYALVFYIILENSKFETDDDDEDEDEHQKSSKEEAANPESPFKVGDKVVINCREEFATAYNGNEGTIIDIFDLEKNHWGNIVVVLDNGMRNTFYASELIKK